MCSGAAGALMVATATASGILPAAARTAAPPRLWPTRMARGFEMVAQMVGCGDEVGHVRRKVGVGELAFAVAKTGEVEAQDGEPDAGQRLGHAPRGEDILGAGKAVGEQHGGARFALGDLQPAGKRLALQPL